MATRRIAIVCAWESPTDAAACAELAILGAMDDLSRHALPPLDASGVRFKRESARWLDAGEERFVLPSLVMERGVGDCDDLATWRAAELRLAGVPATTTLVRQRAGLLHMVVRLPDGSIDDPSARLGMLDGG